MSDVVPQWARPAFGGGRLGDTLRTLDRIVLRALGSRGRILGRVTRNTVGASVAQGGERIGVIPSELELRLDGRILPGQAPPLRLPEDVAPLPLVIDRDPA